MQDKELLKKLIACIESGKAETAQKAFSIVMNDIFIGIEKDNKK